MGVIFAQTSTSVDAVPWTIATVAGVCVCALIWFLKHVMTNTIPNMLLDQKNEREKFSQVIDTVEKHCQSELIAIRAEMATERSAWLAESAQDRLLFQSEIKSCRDHAARENEAFRARNHQLIDQLQGIVGAATFNELMEQRRRDGRGTPADRGSEV